MSTSGVVGGKTAVLPGFFKKERYGGIGGAPPYYCGLTWPVQSRPATEYQGLSRQILSLQLFKISFNPNSKLHKQFYQIWHKASWPIFLLPKKEN